MKFRELLIIVAMVSMFLTGCTEKAHFSVISGKYLGQKPPGMIPEIFAPGIVSTGFDEQFAHFTPDGKELYWLLRGAPHTVILFMKEENGRWTKPRIAPFSGRYFAKLCLSPDGSQIVLTSSATKNNTGEPTDILTTWIVERLESGWGKPELVESLVDIATPSMAVNGDMYFYLAVEGKRDIHKSRFVEGRYAEMINLGDSINTSFNEVDPYISPDESYLIFCSDRSEGAGLYISFSNSEGTWTKAKNMGEEINISPEGCCCPCVSLDGKYLFFTSRKNIYPVFPI